MKLKRVLLIALCCSIVNFVARCLNQFILNGEEYMTIFSCERVRSMSFSNLSVWFSILGILATIFFIVALFKMKEYVKPLIVVKTLVALECLAVLYSLIFLIPELHIIMLYGGQHIVGDWGYWEETGYNIAPMIYRILFNDHIYASLYFGETMSVVGGVFNLIDILANILLIVIFCRMMKLTSSTRIIGIAACLLPIIYMVAVLLGIDVYTPMISQTYLIVNGMLWCSMLLLLYSNSDLLEE